MNNDSWSAMLPGVLASHSQNGSRDMKWVSASGVPFYSVADSFKSTEARRRRRETAGLLGVLLMTALVLAGSPASAGQAAAPRPAQSPIGTMSELMVKIIYPASDAIFYITTRTPANDAEWNDLQGKALMVAESANLLMMPAHMRDEERWLADAKLMKDAGAAAFKAAKAKDVKALEDVNDALYQSCVTCHQHYRPNYGRR
jgi:hypothetical protein